MVSAAESSFFLPTSLVPWITWRCRLVKSTTSKSTRPMRPMPAAARYMPSGAPSPPVPISATFAALQLQLAFHADFGHDQVAAVAQNLVFGQRQAEAPAGQPLRPIRPRYSARSIPCRRPSAASLPCSDSGCLRRSRRRSRSCAACLRRCTGAGAGRAYSLVSDFSTSPTVAPVSCTESFLSAYWRSGVGIRILAIDQFFLGSFRLVEIRTVAIGVIETPFLYR